MSSRPHVVSQPFAKLRNYRRRIPKLQRYNVGPDMIHEHGRMRLAAASAYKSRARARFIEKTSACGDIRD